MITYFHLLLFNKREIVAFSRNFPVVKNLAFCFNEIFFFKGKSLSYERTFFCRELFVMSKSCILSCPDLVSQRNFWPVKKIPSCPEMSFKNFLFFRKALKIAKKFLFCREIYSQTSKSFVTILRIFTTHYIWIQIKKYFHYETLITFIIDSNTICLWSINWSFIKFAVICRSLV